MWTPADTEIPPPPDASKEEVVQWEAARRKQAPVDYNELLKHIPLRHVWSPPSDADVVGRDVVVASMCDIKNGQVECLEFSADEPLENEGLRHIATLTQLRLLKLHSAKVTDAGIDHLTGLRHLVSLDLIGCSITPKGLAKLAGFGELTHVSVDGAEASEAGLMQLKLLPKLERLTLEGPQVSDTTLDLLGAFPKLQYLYLVKTSVTVGGLKRLKQARPDLRILDGRTLS